MRPRHSAFTLIEMLGVLAIMALLSGAASILLNGSRHGADLREAISQLQQADTSCRYLARSSDREVKLIISIHTNQLARSSHGTTALLSNLPGDVKIQRIRTADDTIDFGNVTIAFSPQGCTPSYAVNLVDSVGKVHWTLFAGLTGQMSSVKNDELDSILETTQNATRIDAH